MRMDEDWARSARGGMTFADTGGRASETEMAVESKRCRRRDFCLMQINSE